MTDSPDTTSDSALSPADAAAESPTRKRVRPTTEEHRKEIADYQEAVRILRALNRHYVKAGATATLAALAIGALIGMAFR